MVILVKQRDLGRTVAQALLLQYRINTLEAWYDRAGLPAPRSYRARWLRVQAIAEELIRRERERATPTPGPAAAPLPAGEIEELERLLRALAEHKHSDLTIAADAATALRQQRKEIERLQTIERAFDGWVESLEARAETAGRRIQTGPR